MPKFRYVAVSPDRREQHRAIGKALALHEFLIDHQTDASGRVWYGKAISYAWVRSKWVTAPSERTLERHMARLKACGLVRVVRLPNCQGMRVTVLRSAKWPEAQRQMDLFPAAEILSITREQLVRKQSKNGGRFQFSAAKSGGAAPPFVAVKSSKNQTEEKKNGELASARSAPALDEAAFAARRQLLADQARMLMGKAKGSC